MTRTRVLALLTLLAAASVADANPWSAGVTDAEKQTAQRALDEGNALFLDKRYAEALAKYEQAIAAWDHPAIRFNMVRCFIQLDRVVEAVDNLKLALRYGAAPLEDAVYAEALAYEKLLAKQIGEIVVACEQPGVRVTLDGRPLATCPAREHRRVVPGTHQLVAVKPGLVTRTVELVIVGGTRRELALRLDRIAAARIAHRWPAWLPWTVFGAGFAIAGVGAALELDASSRMAVYERIVLESCRPRACTAMQHAAYDGLRSGAELRGRLGVGFAIAGGATIATGAVLLYLNRARTVAARSERIAPAITPLPGGAAVTLRTAF